MALTANNTVDEWLADPVGGDLIRGLLAERGVPEAMLNPVRSVPLQQVVALSGGMVSQDTVDMLVAKVSG